MPTTPNLGITHLTSNQNQPEVTVNAAIDQLDEAANDTVTLTAGGSPTDLSINSTDFNANVLVVIGGTADTAFDLTVPQNKRLFIVQNDSGKTATVKTAAAGGTVNVLDGERRLLYCDATNIVAVAPNFNVTGGGGGGGGGGGTGGVFKGALVNLSADESIPNNTVTDVPWDAAVYDTDSFWSSGNPTRLTVPAGVTKIVLASQIEWSPDAGGFRQIRFDKNGAIFDGSARSRHFTNTLWSTNRVYNLAVTFPIEVVAGDYFEAQAFQNGGGALNILANEDSWFAIYAVEFDSHRGALVKLLLDQQITEATPTALLWDAEIYDTDGVFTLTSPEKLVVPTGVTKVRLAAGLRWEANASGYRRAYFIKNGVREFDCQGEDIRPAVSGIATAYVIQTPTIVVTGADEFQVEVEHDSTQSGGINVEAQTDAGSPAAAATWFALEIVE